MRLLLIAPHFPPTNAPDGQRLRMLIPEWLEAGCQCTLITARPEDCLAPIEPALEFKSSSKNWQIHRVPASSARFGINNIGLRIRRNLDRFVQDLLSRETFDLVYFSTTQFACLPMGLVWLKKFGLPYVIDLQDPWVNDYYERPGAPKPPGGWKYRIARWRALRQEPKTLGAAAHIISVSGDYFKTLKNRYSWYDSTKGTVMPFGWSDRDQAQARSGTAAISSRPVIRYIGRVGDDMAGLVDQLFGWFKIWVNQGPPAHAIPHWEFIGTSYAVSNGGGVIQTAAQNHGLQEWVSEEPGRIGYFDGLSRLQTSWANLILGSDDTGYSPSKTWPLIATGRPWLAMVRSETIIADVLPRDPSRGLILADHPDPKKQLFHWLDTLTAPQVQPPPPPEEIMALSASSLARKHLEIFEHVTLRSNSRA